jgi:hypothetical protein
MSVLTEIRLDATWKHGRIVAPPTSGELDRLLAKLRQRRSGTLYLMTSGDRYFVMGVASRVGLAHIYSNALGSLWLSNPQPNDRSSAMFDCGGTPTKIQANLTCRAGDAVLACREFFLAPEAIPTGNWINGYSGLPVGSGPAFRVVPASPPASEP